MTSLAVAVTKPLATNLTLEEFQFVVYRPHVHLEVVLEVGMSEVFSADRTVFSAVRREWN